MYSETMSETMAEAEQALAATVDAPAKERSGARRPRKLIEIIPTQLELLRAHRRNVLDTDNVEAVHKMRVTTRRLQASLDLLQHEMSVHKLKRRLRKWRRALSLVRNYDVFLELIEKEAATKGRARRVQFQFVMTRLQHQRLQSAARVRRILERANIDKIAIRLHIAPSPGSESSVSADPLTVASTTVGLSSLDERRVAAYAADRLDQRLAEFQALVAQSHPTADPTDLHQLRIAAKRVRYLLEIVSQMGFGDASQALRWLRTLQDRIGDWHDLEALEQEIISIVSDRGFMKEHLAESSGMLQAAAHLQKKKEALVSRLFPVRAPRYLEVTSQRIARALRRKSVRRRVPLEKAKPQ